MKRVLWAMLSFTAFQNLLGVKNEAFDLKRSCNDYVLGKKYSSFNNVLDYLEKTKEQNDGYFYSKNILDTTLSKFIRIITVKNVCWYFLRQMKEESNVIQDNIDQKDTTHQLDFYWELADIVYDKFVKNLENSTAIKVFEKTHRPAAVQEVIDELKNAQNNAKQNNPDA